MGSTFQLSQTRLDLLPCTAAIASMRCYCFLCQVQKDGKSRLKGRSLQGL